MIFKQAEVFYKGEFKQLDVQVKDDLIVQVAPRIEDTQDETIDCQGKRLLPGVIDVHSHGCMGYDFSTASEEEIIKMLNYYAAHGVTGICGTTMTMATEPYKEAMRRIQRVATTQTAGSRFLGINMEGPFLGKDKKGAHDEQYLTGLDSKLFEELDDLSGNRIRIVDLDPNLEGSMEFIKTYSKTKTVSIAHTSCTYDTAMKAISNGATQITHLFNAMNGLHHREPGVVGALSDSDIRAEIITDGVHIHPAVLRMMFGYCPEKLMIVSDTMCACGLEDGEYVLGGLTVTVKEGKATLVDGTIAGSTTNAYDGMVRAIGFGVNPADAILSATLIPATAIGAQKEVGSIEVGKFADLIVTDMDFSIENVYCNGEKHV